MKTDKNIEQELHEIAPILASLSKPKNEAIPAFYFSSVKESILEKVRQNEISAELKTIAPNLSSLAKPSSVVLSGQIPANYFETLPNKVFATIQKQERAIKNAEKTGFFEQIIIWLESIFAVPQLQVAFATIISTIVLSGVYFSFDKEAENTQILAEAKSNLTKEDIKIYLLEYSDEVEESTLENQVEQNPIQIEAAYREEMRAYFGEDILSEENENV